ncbi:PapC-like porin protein involved in fimbrial biogenesis [Alloalcanivorax dieselolei B5]|uniref:PapC-like porin protein involved in fimbrial biogenesis n=1 Tax=Alcanivorax dieselolei (strain DSM 16502 / CGMCC 1.3690 / MCCC 1A00001 / B-5) TaxID=930169 RepID=K0C4X1_ALCDB|nr:PapC-like porin protein involved in fimbrial biogenesis [Alloalcanivorax dieselolei B5]GGJ99810.1 outer membrane usher protein [Alloalcanivorax dieselolei]
MGAVLLVGATTMVRAEDLDRTPEPGLDESTLAFNPHFLSLQGGQSAVGLQSLARDRELPAGEYQVDVLVNGHPVGRMPVTFNESERSSDLTPCFSAQSAEWLDINPAYLSARGLPPEYGGCDLLDFLEQAEARFHPDRLVLEVSIPQAALRRRAGDYIDPDEWDRGITALRLDYTINNAWNEEAGGGRYRDQYGDFRLGVDWRGWHLRSSHVYRRDSREQGQWEDREMYAYRALPGIRGELTLGESFTRSRINESLPYTGIQLRSDTAMLPVSQQGFSPVIRGIARGNARVVVRQNGFVIYSTYVPPGAFSIDDLPSLSNGDLEVEIQEQDGEIRRFIQPYSLVPNLVREGFWEYSLVAGRYRSNSGDDLGFVQTELSHGLPGNITAYGSFTISEDYYNSLLGAGLNLGRLGSVSADITHARTRAWDESTWHGQSYRLLYAKGLGTGTNFQLLGYRYSSERFRTFNEAVLMRDPGAISAPGRKQRMEATVSQSLGRYGSAYVSASRESYWHDSDRQSLLSLGYNGNVGSLSFGLTVTDSRYQGMDRERLYMLSLSLPMDTPASRGYVDYRLTVDEEGNADHGVGTSGVLNEHPEWSYGIRAGHQEEPNRNNGNAQLAYAGDRIGLSAGAAFDGDSRRQYLQAQGSAIVHQGGLTFGRGVGETALLAHVSEIAGASFAGGAAPVRTNSKGYALLPYAQPYRPNRLRVGMESLDYDVEVPGRSRSVVPERGAIARVAFPAYRVKRFLVALEWPGGHGLPLGAEVLNEQSDVVGMVAENSRAMITVKSTDKSLFHIHTDEGVCRFEITRERLGAATNRAVETISKQCER